MNSSSAGGVLSPQQSLNRTDRLTAGFLEGHSITWSSVWQTNPLEPPTSNINVGMYFPAT